MTVAEKLLFHGTEVSCWLAFLISVFLATDLFPTYFMLFFALLHLFVAALQGVCGPRHQSFGGRSVLLPTSGFLRCWTFFQPPTTGGFCQQTARNTKNNLLRVLLQVQLLNEVEDAAGLLSKLSRSRRPIRNEVPKEGLVKKPSKHLLRGYLTLKTTPKQLLRRCFNHFGPLGKGFLGLAVLKHLNMWFYKR